MATLLISEFTNEQLGVPGPIAQAPPFVEQTPLTYTTTAASAAFSDDTVFVRLEALGAEAYLEFGTAPTATTANTLHLAAAAVEYFAVTAGHKVAAYDGSS